jgi:photosystem II stability/assembly factor-like uncharacterized protein
MIRRRQPDPLALRPLAVPAMPSVASMPAMPAIVAAIAALVAFAQLPALAAASAARRSPPSETAAAQSLAPPEEVTPSAPPGSPAPGLAPPSPPSPPSTPSTPSAPLGAHPPPAASAAPGWRTMPIWGGDIRSMAIAPDDPDLVLAGTTTGQLYLSRDGGASWRDAGAPLPFPGWVVSSLRWDPNRRGRLWVALWGVWGSGQVAYSDNFGETWVARSGGLPDEPVYSLALVPGSPGHLFVGTLSGVWGSDDGGGDWRRLTAALPELEKVTSLVVDPTRPDTVIAGSWRRAYRSEDGGRTWAGVFEGMVLDTEIFSFTPVPEHPGEIWASSCGWVYQTVDHGDHWVRFKDFEERRTLSFAVLPDGRLLAGTVAGVFVSIDGGKSWRRLSDPALSVTAIAFHPARPGRILIGTEGAGVWMTTNGGGDFFRASRGMTATRVGALALDGNDLLVGVNHAGPISGVYVSPDRGKTFSGDFAPLPTVLDLAVYAGHAYAATARGLYERRGAAWHRLPELGTDRVEQLLVEDEPGAPPRLAARTLQAIFELERGVFVRRAYKHGSPRSAAFYGGGLWISDPQAVYELTREANHTVAAPLAGGRLHRLGEQLLLAGPGGLWARPGPAADWVQVTSEPSRVVPTGDDRFAALLLAGDGARLYDRDSHKFRRLPLPVPARDVAAALVVDGKLLIATSGYGVLVRGLD